MLPNNTSLISLHSRGKKWFHMWMAWTGTN